METRTRSAAERPASAEPADERDGEATAIFAELGLVEGTAKRHLLESERFRALLEAPSLARAA